MEKNDRKKMRDQNKMFITKISKKLAEEFPIVKSAQSIGKVIKKLITRFSKLGLPNVTKNGKLKLETNCKSGRKQQLQLLTFSTE
ncbi:MAG: hypothetical protein H7Y04_13945, partial [Verrucomicrobia bacterium]|nr:hypothetical protein [Cytophagales bacterium]